MHRLSGSASSALLIFRVPKPNSSRSIIFYTASPQKIIQIIIILNNSWSTVQHFIYTELKVLRNINRQIGFLLRICSCLTQNVRFLKLLGKYSSNSTDLQVAVLFSLFIYLTASCSRFQDNDDWQAGESVAVLARTELWERKAALFVRRAYCPLEDGWEQRSRILDVSRDYFSGHWQRKVHQ